MPRDGAPATVWPVVLQAIRTCADPLGATVAALCAATGLTQRQVSDALVKLRKTRRAFARIAGHGSRYYPTEAARDAARPTLDAATRVRQRITRGKGWKRPRPVYEAILAAVKGSQDPLGLTRAAVRAETGIDSNRVAKAVTQLVDRGELFILDHYRESRLFLTAAAAEAAKPAVQAHVEALRRQAKAVKTARSLVRRRERYAESEEYREAVKAQSRRKHAAAAAKKKQRAAKPAPVVLAPAAPQSPDIEKRKRWAEQEPIKPPGLEVTVCPGFKPRTFAPPPFFRGEFTEEWRRKRAATTEAQAA